MHDPEMPVGQVGEDALIEYLRGRIPGDESVVVGVGDDAAAVETGGVTLVTTDVLVENVHFRREWSPPRLLGRKALSVNLSDIAAMAGLPRYATVSLVLPPGIPMGFVDGLYDGLLERAAETGVQIVGGNLSASRGGIVIDVTLLGRGDRLLVRSGAQPGDLIVVTGTLGAAAAGLRLLAQGARLSAEGELEATGMWTASSAPALQRCLQAQLDPAPPLTFARSLAEHTVAHAGIDLSDGLSRDLLRLCQASGVGARVEAAAVPLDQPAAGLERAQGGDALALALHGGEDYELLLAVPPSALEPLRELAAVWDLAATVVGEFSAGAPEVLLDDGRETRPLAPLAHDHFRSEPAGGGAGPASEA